MAPRKKETPRRSGPQTAIGIDFGTSKCCVGLVRNGKVEILENERGSKTTPSYVAFTEAERLVGESALDQVALNPINTVFEAKRLLGRKGEGTTWGLERHLPFDVTQEKCGVRIKVTYKGKERRLSPEQIAAMMLSQMKQLAEKHLGSPVLNAVIAVPAHFNNAQRKAIKDAGTIAGLSVLGLISESAAAVLAYQDGKTLAKKQNVLLVDSGGGAFNAAVVEVQDASVKVKAICGTPELSGGGMDQFLVDHLAESFTKRNNVDLKGNEKALERLRLACQKAKHTLTLLPETVVRVDCLVGNEDCSDTVTRAEFIGKFLPAAQETIKNVLNSVLCDAKLTPPDVDEVVLIGGTTRVPAVQEELVKFFGGKALNKTVNPDEAVAHGAALQAAILAGDNTLQEITVVDIIINPFIYSSIFEKPPDKWLIIPKFGEEYPVYFDQRPYKVDKSKKKLHHFIDSFGIYNPQGGTPSSIEKMKNSDNNVKLIQSYLTDEEVDAMTREVEEIEVEDEEHRKHICALSDLEALCFSVKGRLTSEEFSKTANEDLGQRSKALELCNNILDWLDFNELPSKKDCEDRRTKLQDLFDAAVKTMADKFNEAVKEQRSVQIRTPKNKMPKTVCPNVVKCSKQVENTAKLDTDRSEPLLRSGDASQSKGLSYSAVVRGKRANGSRNDEGTHTETLKAAAAASRVNVSQECAHEVKRIQGTVTAAKTKSTPAELSPSMIFERLSNEITGDSYATSTPLTHGAQCSLLDYRDPSHKRTTEEKGELKDDVLIRDGDEYNVCNGSSDSSVKCNEIEFISQSIQNINISSSVTDSENGSIQVQNNFNSLQLEPNSKLPQDTLYSKALNHAGHLQVSGAPPPQTVSFNEPMEVGAPDHDVNVSSEDKTKNNNCYDQQQLCYNRQERGCGPAALNGNVSQDPLLPEPFNYVVSQQVQDLGLNQPGYTFSNAEIGEHHYFHNKDQEILGLNNHRTTSYPQPPPVPAPMLPPHPPPSLPPPPHHSPTPHHPPTPPQCRPYSYQCHPGGHFYGHNVLPFNLQELIAQIAAHWQISLEEAARDHQIVQQYINHSRQVFQNWDRQHSLYPPVPTCFFCFYSPYAIKLRRCHFELYYMWTGCSAPVCAGHFI